MYHDKIEIDNQVTSGVADWRGEQRDEIQTRPIPLTPTLSIGRGLCALIAGPCSVESYEQTYTIGQMIHAQGGKFLRGGAFKPRTSPRSFQGLGEEGLKILRAVADEFDLLVVTEALGTDQLRLVAEYADIIQVGSRNMQHFPLLWAVGEIDKPVLLKRGFMATIQEWLLAAEHIVSRGNQKIVLCERGIRGFDPATRNVLDVSAIALVNRFSPFPVIADPSHATGRADLVLPTARAALAAGANGIMIEVHPVPALSLSDREQAIPLDILPEVYHDLRNIAGSLNNRLI